MVNETRLSNDAELDEVKRLLGYDNYISEDETKKRIKILKDEYRRLQYGRHRKGFTELSDWQIIEYSDSLMPLTLSRLRGFDNSTLMQIILIREAGLYRTIDKFNDSLNKQDKEIFKDLREENIELRKWIDLNISNNTGSPPLLSSVIELKGDERLTKNIKSLKRKVTKLSNLLIDFDMCDKCRYHFNIIKHRGQAIWGEAITEIQDIKGG